MEPKIDTWEMNADEARKQIAAAHLTQDELVNLHAREQANPKGPRKTVLDALEERIGESKVADPAPGLARQSHTDAPPPPEDSPAPAPPDEKAESSEDESALPRRGDRCVFLDGSGNVHESVLETFDVESLIGSFYVGARIQVAHMEVTGTVPGTWRPLHAE